MGGSIVLIDLNPFELSDLNVCLPGSSMKSLASLLSILAVLGPASGLQLRHRGLQLLPPSREFEIYRSSPGLYPNETEIRYENIGFGVPAFEVDAGLNFSLYCSGPRREGHRLGWTSDSLQFHSEVIL